MRQRWVLACWRRQAVRQRELRELEENLKVNSDCVLSPRRQRRHNVPQTTTSQASRVGVRATPIRPPPRVVVPHTAHPKPDPASTWAPLDIVSLMLPKLRARCRPSLPKVLYVKMLLDAGGLDNGASGLGQWLRAKMTAVNHTTVHLMPGDRTMLMTIVPSTNRTQVSTITWVCTTRPRQTVYKPPWSAPWWTSPTRMTRPTRPWATWARACRRS